MDIAQLAEQQPAPYVVAAIEATDHTRPTPRLGAALVAGAAGAGPAEV